MGVTMFLQQKLNPAPADPVQAQVFQFLPIMFTFMLAPFSAGLVIYWAWSNTLSIAQQYTIMRRHGTPIGGKAQAKAAAAKAGDRRRPCRPMAAAAARRAARRRADGPSSSPRGVRRKRSRRRASSSPVPASSSPARPRSNSLIPISLPEVAFAGRSNVGKSSLVNALTGRRTLARTSSSPGHTRQINFFDLGQRLFLVDLPGYGFAQVSRSMKETWQDLASAYLRGRPTLKRVCLLIDSRHGVKDTDRETMKNLDAAAVSYQLVLTKTDQLKPAQIPAAIAAAEAVARKHGAAHPQVLPTSSETGFGIAELRAEIMDVALGTGSVR